MKKFYTILLILLISGYSAFSQILIAPHTTTDYSGPDTVKLTAHATITNSGSQTLDVVCERFSVNPAPNHFAYFCWVVCYDTSVSLSPTPIQLAPGASTSNFEGWMGSSNTAGYDEATYRFYDKNGLSDTLYLTFTYEFIGTTGISELSASKYSLNILGVNPANTSTIISYNVPSQKEAKIIVSNLLGSKVNEFYLNNSSNSMVIPLAEYKSGVYIYSLSVDGVIVNSKKLIVAHE